MKRWIRILSLTALAVGLIQIGRLMRPEQPADSSSMPKSVFRQFPVGHVKTVELEWGSGSLRRLNQREQKDQALDWLMLALLPESGFSQDEISKLTFDLPPVRAGYFQPIGNFEYGGSRSRYLGNGQVLALVPRADQPQRTRIPWRANIGGRSEFALTAQHLSGFERVCPVFMVVHY